MLGFKWVKNIRLHVWLAFFLRGLFWAVKRKGSCDRKIGTSQITLVTSGYVAAFTNAKCYLGWQVKSMHSPLSNLVCWIEAVGRWLCRSVCAALVPHCNTGNLSPEKLRSCCIYDDCSIRQVGLYFPWFFDTKARISSSDMVKTDAC